MEWNREGGGASEKIMGSEAGPYDGDWLLDSTESLRSCVTYDIEHSVQGKKRGSIYPLTPSHRGSKFFPTVC